MRAVTLAPGRRNSLALEEIAEPPATAAIPVFLQKAASGELVEQTV